MFGTLFSYQMEIYQNQLYQFSFKICLKVHAMLLTYRLLFKLDINYGKRVVGGQLHQAKTNLKLKEQFYLRSRERGI